jgi:glycosyltransferase involved in cell wall biosynthesis
MARKFKGNTRVVQTLLTEPKTPEQYREIVFGDQCIVFSVPQKQEIEKILPYIPVRAIPPCVSLPDTNLLQPATQIREKYEVEDRLLAVVLNDVCSKQHFDSFLYVVREFHRRGEFRLLIPHFKNDKQTMLWRSRLEESIQQERLHSTTILSDNAELMSLIDTSDLTLYLEKEPDPSFEFSLIVLEAITLGKPVIGFNVPQLKEILGEVQPRWICNNVEDIVRESRDLRKELAGLEQLSTELARYGRKKFGVDSVAELHRELYEHMMATA